MEELKELPEGWVHANLEDVCDICDNLRKPINSAERLKRVAGKPKNELYPYYGATGLVGYIDGYLTDGEYVLLGEDGAPFLDYTKNVAYLINGKTWVNNHAHILLSYSNNKYLLHFLNQFNYKGYVSGTTRLKLTQSSMKKMPVKVAPLPEQHRIVAKIEELFSSLDKGIESLKTAQAQLKTYRQAVLKWAFEGKLTNENVKDGELPEGWKWVAVNDVTNKLDQGWSPKCENEKSDSINEWAVIKTTAIQHNYFRESENKKLPFDLRPRVQHELVKNDILVTRAGPRVRVGVCGLVKNVRPKLLNCDKAYRIKVKEDIINPSYLVNALNSPQFLEIIENCKSGGNDSGLNLTQNVFLSIKVPLPPTIAEQTHIVSEIETRLSVCDKLEESITQSLLQAEGLRQSILKKAFEGKLVPQNPNDEPAGILLERIRAERALVVAKKATASNGKKGKGRSK